MEPVSRSARFAHNIGWNAFGQFGIAVAGFVVTPFLVNSMGTATYGFYILMHTISSYLLVLAGNTGAGAIKFISEFKAAGDGRGVRQAVTYSGLCHGVGPAMGALALAVAAPFVAGRLLDLPPVDWPSAVFTLRCAAIGAVFLAVYQWTGSAFQGLQRFDWQNLLNLMQSLLLLLGAAALLSVGRGLRAVAVWFVASSAAAALVSVWLLRRNMRWWPPARGAGLSPRRFFSYSLWFWLGQLAILVTYQFDKVAITRYLSLNELSLYSVPAGFVQRFQVLPTMFFVVLMPMISELGGLRLDEDLRRLYLKSVRILLWACLPPLVLLFALIPQFLSLWLGGDFGTRSVWPARFLVLAQAWLLFVHVPNAVAAGRGRPGLITALAWGQAVLSVLLWKALIPRYALLGVAAGSLVGQVAPALIITHLVHRGIVGVTFKEYAEEALLRPLASAALLLAVIMPLHGQASSWPRFLALVAAGAALYYGSTWFMLGREDREMFRRLVRP